MQITLNNTKETIEKDTISFDELIKLKNFTFKMLVTKLNGNLVRKEDRANTYISENDDVIVLHLISGG